ncbi:hypothetical protein TNCV_4738361 [Trichonephila clavipes]|nr:hypothetical protein TNCV_4738361 [Trichonephila clavipes]
MVANDAKIVANLVANDAKIVANLVAKNDANLALPPRFRQVLIEAIITFKQVTRTTPELENHSPNYHTKGKRLSLIRFNVHLPLLHGVSSVKPGLEPATPRPQVRDHNHLATMVTMAQQPMRFRAYCAHPSKRDHWALKCMSRCPDLMVSLKREPQCLSPQESLVLIYRPTAVGMKG